jgi:hypothetical protein
LYRDGEKARAARTAAGGGYSGVSSRLSERLMFMGKNLVTEKQGRILVGYNLYFTSDEVIKVAIDHAHAFGGKLFVVSSIVGHSLSPSISGSTKVRVDGLDL